MPNHKSCVKKCKVNERRRKCNLDRKQKYKANVRKLKKEVSLTHSSDKNKNIKIDAKKNTNVKIDVNDLLKTIKKQLDKIGAKHIYHKNKVARLKSKYEKIVNNFNAKQSQNQPDERS